MDSQQMVVNNQLEEMVLNGDVDGQNEVEIFRDSLRSINSERGKFQACLEMRDKLLDRHTELKWLFASIEGVMLTECAQYKRVKSGWPKGIHSDIDTRRWRVFLGFAASGAGLRRECLAPLSKASMCWEVDKVQHYKWGTMGWKYCKVLGTAASRNPDWKEASIKLNRLFLNRILSRRPLKISINPVEVSDLKCLSNWLGQREFDGTDRNGSKLQYKPVLRCDLPFGYTFDRYGLIVDQRFGCVPEPIQQSHPRTTNASVGTEVQGYASSVPAPSPEYQTPRSSSMPFYSSAIHTSTLSDSREIDEDTGICVDEESLQYTLLKDMSQWSSSNATSRTVSRQPSIMSDNAEGQPPNATQDAATEEEAEIEGVIRLTYETLAGLQSSDQNLTRKIIQSDQQSDSLQKQIGMELVEVDEPTTQHIRKQLQNLDEERIKQRTERSLLRQDLRRRCLTFLGDVNL